jgi:hypothetical protein
MLEVQNILDDFAEEDKRLRSTQKQELVNSWRTTIQEKKSQVLPPEENSLSNETIMRFTGEDEDHDLRVKAQQEQMKRWVQEQIDVKSSQRLEEKYQEDKYAEMVKAIAEIREVAEREEVEMRQYLNASIRDENLELAKYQREQRDRENKTWKDKELVQATTLKVAEEDGIDEEGRILRRDFFRGYTVAQRQRILEENEILIQQKR